ncbi:FHA domain-containing protein [Paenibacillaceae bacterium WGS1546]|uniref:FHA domain-containing protein n=1 Tax=Cohnella sp. WGS1546 TaxID=3366810 RepID=UPI00372D726F
MKKSSSTPCLVVVRGFPYDEGSTLRLRHRDVILGRKDGEWEPDIGFENVYVSRKQAGIRCEDGQYFITDFDSKHGTEVNGIKILPFTSSPLRSSDIITFARGMICLAFSTKMWEETMDFFPVQQPSAVTDEYRLDPVRQTLWLEDMNYSFSDKEYRCLELLLQKERQFVAKDEIIRYVWPERTASDDLPAASSEELNSLLYRIRKKTTPILSIENIRGKGYILTLSRLAEKFV